VRVEAIYISPVKSLALLRVERVTLGKHGIFEDRRFFLVSDKARLVTQREVAQLTQVRADYTLQPETLRLRFPDGRQVEGAPVSGEPITSRFFGERDVEGCLVEGTWSAALSEFAGMPVRLVRAETSAFDVLPVSICSEASVEALRAHSGEHSINERRFRPNFYVSGCEAHGEDAWIGGSVRLGANAVVQVVMADGRCAITTHNSDTGERDMSTLKMIAAYRPLESKEVNFGVYGGVELPGEVVVGDEVVPLSDGLEAMR
jgi:uncharacterized protein YcbX